MSDEPTKGSHLRNHLMLFSLIVPLLESLLMSMDTKSSNEYWGRHIMTSSLGQSVSVIMLRFVPTHTSKVSNRRSQNLQLILPFAYAASCHMSVHLTKSSSYREQHGFDCECNCQGIFEIFTALKVATQEARRPLRTTFLLETYRNNFRFVHRVLFKIKFNDFVEVILRTCMRNAGAGGVTAALFSRHAGAGGRA